MATVTIEGTIYNTPISYRDPEGVIKTKLLVLEGRDRIFEVFAFGKLARDELDKQDRVKVIGHLERQPLDSLDGTPVGYLRIIADELIQVSDL